MNKLKEYNFNELYKMSSGISSKPEQAGQGSSFLSFSTTFNNYFLPGLLPNLMNSSKEEQKKHSIQKDDIFLTRTSETIDELGMSSVAMKDYPNATFSGFIKRLRPIQENITYAKYMGFYLRSKFFRKTMTNNAILTLRASLNEEVFSYLKLLLPDYTTQKSIGDFLYLLNKKIELNQRINFELEFVIKNIYDYWFAQFDFPNEIGKPYKSSGGRMIWNNVLKRKLPEGWEVKAFSEYTDVRKGDMITAKTSKKGEIKVVAGGISSSYTHVESNRAANTITISGSGANAGYINFWREPIFASDCITVRGKTDVETLAILQHLRFVQNHILNQAKGSAQPHVYPDDIKVLNYAIPKKYLMDKFGELIIPINDQIANNIKQNNQLAKLRDWLLPMLITGQVKIS
jgi:type I restriction enzyme, S subunit